MNSLDENKNAWLVRDWSQYKICPVYGHYVYHTHDCDKGH